MQVHSCNFSPPPRYFHCPVFSVLSSSLSLNYSEIRKWLFEFLQFLIKFLSAPIPHLSKPLPLPVLYTTSIFHTLHSKLTDVRSKTRCNLFPTTHLIQYPSTIHSHSPPRRIICCHKERPQLIRAPRDVHTSYALLSEPYNMRVIIS